MRKFWLSGFAAAALALPLFSEIVLVAPADQAEISGMAPELKQFLSMPQPARRAVFNDKKRRAKLRKLRDARPTEFAWRCTEGERGPFKLEISCDQQFSAPAPVLCLTPEPNRECRAKAVNFRLGSTYFWRVTGRDAQGNVATSKTGTFVSDAFAPRLLFVPKTGNMRDLGGRKGLDGKMIRQGMIYRSAGLNRNCTLPKDKPKNEIDASTLPPGKPYLTAEGVTFFVKTLGIRTDLDLRSHLEVGSMRGSPAGADVKWIRHASHSYGSIFSSNGKKVMAKNFRVFCDRSNYPVDFHCIAGADRTGALAYVLEGVLGVDADELEKDWQITANGNFGYGGAKADFIRLAGGFPKYGSPDDPLVRRIELYLLDCGVTPQEIATFRSIMLE